MSVLVDCEWSSWSEWGLCSASCGSGVQRSTHFVVQPRQYGGRECEGPSHRTRVCAGPDCGKNLNHVKTLGLRLEYCMSMCVCIDYAATIF